jgi:hypothetical protein
MKRTPEKDAALFIRDGEQYLPTFYTQGPWDPGTQFGGAPAALVATLVERTPSLVPMQIARLTVDLLRPVPMTALTPRITVVREGKKIQVVEASLLADGVEVTRATALRVRRAQLDVEGLPDGERPNPLPTSPRETDEDVFTLPVPHGARFATEWRFEESGGHYGNPSWIRLRADVIAGERPLPVAKLAFVADTASGVGLVRALGVSWTNADLALNVVREPVGDWLSIDGEGWVGHTGTGQVQATVWDTEGVVATISMVRFVNL